MKTYIIEKTCGAPDWSTVPALEADNHLWITSENIHMTAQICYDEEALYLYMRAVEREVRAEHRGKLCLLYETRAETLVGHQPGEVCFPGGRREKGEKPVDTALRETWEELGIPAEAIEVLAPLDVVQDISDRVIYPFLALVKPEGMQKCCACECEVKNTFCVPLDFLLDYQEEVYRYPVRFESDDKFPFAKVGFPDGYKWRSGWMDIPIYEYEGHIIWGMTGRILRDLTKE